jgi:hypothetical protein
LRNAVTLATHDGQDPEYFFVAVASYPPRWLSFMVPFLKKRVGQLLELAKHFENGHRLTDPT